MVTGNPSIIVGSDGVGGVVVTTDVVGTTDLGAEFIRLLATCRTQQNSNITQPTNMRIIAQGIAANHPRGVAMPIPTKQAKIITAIMPSIKK